MPTTTRAALRYPALTDPDNVPGDLATLAGDVDGQLYRALPCTSSTRPTGVPDGFLIRETDTGNVMVYNAAGTTWVQVGGGGGGGSAYAAVEGWWRATSVQSIGTSDTVVAFGVQEVASAIVTRATSGPGHKFILGESGMYYIQATVRFAAGTGGRRFAEIRDAAQATRFGSSSESVSTGDPSTLSPQAMKRFTAGAEVVVIATQTGQGTLALEPEGSAIVAGSVRIGITKVSG